MTKRNLTSIMDLPAGPIRDQAARQIAAQMARETPPEPETRRNKYGAKRTEYKSLLGFTRIYDSMAEARYAASLDADVKIGLVRYWLPQVPFPLPGGVKYVADFMVIQTLGSIQFIDVKGRDTQASINKRKQVKALFGVDITIIQSRSVK